MDEKFRRKERLACKYQHLPIQELFEKTRGHYMAGIAAQVCLDLGFLIQHHLKGGHTLLSYLQRFKTTALKREFLSFYVVELNALVAENSACECMHFTDPSEPCEHDWKIFEQTRQPVPLTDRHYRA